MRPFTAALDLRRYVGRWSLHSASHAGRFFFLILDLVRGILESAATSRKNGSLCLPARVNRK